MSSNGDTETVMKYITNGASDFLIKPVRIEELKNIWQHVFRKKIGEEHSKTHNAQHGIDQLLAYPPKVAPPCPVRTTGSDEAAMALESELRETNSTVTDIRDLRKSRLSWTLQLHRQFITAVNSLGAESK
jgi:two-component response regulator ARR-B family